MAKGHLTTKCHMWPLYFQLSEREFLEISHQFLSLKKKKKHKPQQLVWHCGIRRYTNPKTSHSGGRERNGTCSQHLSLSGHCPREKEQAAFRTSTTSSTICSCWCYRLGSLAYWGKKKKIQVWLKLLLKEILIKQYSKLTNLKSVRKIFWCHLLTDQCIDKCRKKWLMHNKINTKVHTDLLLLKVIEEVITEKWMTEK